MVILHVQPKTKLKFHINNFGDVYIDDKHLGELSITSNIIGKTGPTGLSIAGLKGYKGEFGHIGPTGGIGKSIPGTQGYIGDNGPKGCMGKIGIRGDEGQTGPTGMVGSKGLTLYGTPKYFLYAKIDKNFQYATNQKEYTILPWFHIANNGFKLQNTEITFPKRYGVYKIECGLQVTNFSNINCQHTSELLVSNSLQIELRLSQKYCKSNAYIIPYCQKYKTNISNCETLHHIITITEKTVLTVYLNTCGNIQDIQDTMFLSIMEIF
jgi:hypothetical protein